MTVQDFYKSVGGDYETALTFFKSDEKLLKYLRLYIQDSSYQNLCEAVSNHDVAQAFDASHALKGVAGTLQLTALYKATVALVEQLRPQDAPVDEELFQNVCNLQQLTVGEACRLVESHQE